MYNMLRDVKVYPMDGDDEYDEEMSIVLATIMLRSAAVFMIIHDPTFLSSWLVMIALTRQSVINEMASSECSFTKWVIRMLILYYIAYNPSVISAWALFIATL